MKKTSGLKYRYTLRYEENLSISETILLEVINLYYLKEKQSIREFRNCLS